MSIKGVIFDYGGVILDMRWDIARELALDHGLGERSIVDTLYGSDTWRQVETGKGDREAWLVEAHTKLEEMAGRPIPPLHVHWREKQHLIDGNVALIERLRPAYRTALLSNADLTLRDRLRTFGLDRHFDAIVISADVGMAKPEPGIYALAAERIGLPPGECVFVDDMASNIEAARAAGMEGVHYRVDLGHDLAAQLAELGVRTG